ncbi:hypothetical protein P618_200841 [Holospora obtusa F1]|uniref:Uncharacterized protein n=1 Tax=Holospora obtusa F1 TaxID=1399147 RepID=W6TD91_HOLOB|nr:hypothetical protein P618_200841 [Holospora obtusa F1]
MNETFQTIKTEIQEMRKKVQVRGIWKCCGDGIRIDTLNSITKMHGKTYVFSPDHMLLGLNTYVI